MQEFIKSAKDLFVELNPLSQTGSTEKGGAALNFVLPVITVFSGFLFFSGIILFPPERETASLLYAHISDFLFFIYFLILFFLSGSRRIQGHRDLILTLSVSVFFLYNGLQTGSDQIALLWFFCIPLVSCTTGGIKKGLLASIPALILIIWISRDSGQQHLVKVSGLYLISLFFSAASAHGRENRRTQSHTRGISGKKPEEGDQKTLNRYEFVLKELAGMTGESHDCYVVYSRDVLSTLYRKPQPEAVLSYILLEGMSHHALFEPETETGDLPSVSGFGIEDFFSRVEHVLELRNAKKSLEFNKIQTRVNRVLSASGDSREEGATLEEVFSHYHISEREIDIALCILKGSTNREISKELFISIETVKTHVKNILKKFGISNRIELIKLLTTTPTDL